MPCLSSTVPQPASAGKVAMDDETDFEAELQALSADYAARIPDKLAQIEQAWVGLPADRWDEEGFYLLHRMVHNLAGSGRTFGFALLSDVAHRFEAHLRELAQAKTVCDSAERQRIRTLLDELRQAARQRNGSG
jgi:HPt (histidine-containing phosphotransfer) domain-containing protein